MAQPLLSILIPTVVGREKELNNLLFKIKGGMAWEEVKIGTSGYEAHYGKCISLPICFQVYKDNKEHSIGEKREFMYNQSMGLYSQMTDDDDELAPSAIELILEAIKSNPNVDCITFQENCQMNGKYYKSNHSLEYPDWDGDGSHPLHDGFHYHRTPFYKSVIKTEIAKSVPFKHVRYGEDHLWSIDLYPHLKTEIHIDRELYYYIYEPKDTNEERYGLNTK